MEEKTTVKLKKEEYALREAVKKMIGKGKVSNVKIEYTPVGEKIIISTNKPGLVIGRGGEKLNEITVFLKKNFKLDNLHKRNWSDSNGKTSSSLDTNYIMYDIKNRNWWLVFPGVNFVAAIIYFTRGLVSFLHSKLTLRKYTNFLTFIFGGKKKHIKIKQIIFY